MYRFGAEEYGIYGRRNDPAHPVLLCFGDSTLFESGGGNVMCVCLYQKSVCK